MYKVKAIQGMNVLINDLGLTVTNSSETIIPDEEYDSSLDIKKVEKFLDIKKISQEQEEVSEVKLESEENVINSNEEEKTIFTKEIDNIEDVEVVEEAAKEKIFVANYNEPDIKLDDNVQEVTEPESNVTKVEEVVAEPIVRKVEDNSTVKAEEKPTKEVKRTRKKVESNNSEKKTRSPRKAKTVKSEAVENKATELENKEIN